MPCGATFAHFGTHFLHFLDGSGDKTNGMNAIPLSPLDGSGDKNNGINAMLQPFRVGGSASHINMYVHNTPLKGIGVSNFNSLLC